MKFTEYQKNALKTDQSCNIEISTLGLSASAGNVQKLLQIHQRLGSSYNEFRSHMMEALGDVYWYIASIASIEKISLEAIAIESTLYSYEVWNGANAKRQKRFKTKADVNDASIFAKEVGKTDMRKDFMVSVLGLLGECGSVATALKLRIRDSNGRKTNKYKKEIRKNIADCLWYTTSISNISKIKINLIFENNIKSINNRYSNMGVAVSDSDYEDDEQFPRKFDVLFKEREIRKNKKQILMQINGLNVGDRLTDNTNFNDGYRYHDVFHLAYVAILGWSPVLRGLLKRKRKSILEIDENEDGARAAITEETVSLMIYHEANNYDFFRGPVVPDHLLHFAQTMCKNLEVNICTSKKWEEAILEGYRVFNLLNENCGGIVMVDLDRGKINFRRSPS